MSKDTIRSLTEREQARDKVSVWFGSRDNFIHPFKEVIANSIDEISNNFENGYIKIELSEDLKTMTIHDTGRGIPIEGETQGTPNYKLLLLKLFAGTNYDNNEYGKITTGTNGVGLTVTNYCSTYFAVTSYRPEGIYEIKFENGGNISKELTKISDNTDCKHGTSITFTLDDEVFTNVKYDLNEVLEIVKNLSGVSPSIEFEVIHKGKTYEFKYDSFKSYFEEIMENRTCKTAIGHSKTYESDEKNIIQCMIATSSSPMQRAFLNITYLTEGGSINRGMIYGMRDYVNQYIKDKKLIDKKLGEVSHTDIDESVSFAVNMLSTKVEFANQTKLSTNKALYMKIAKDYVQEVLEVFKVEQPKEFEKFINHILEVQKHNGKAQAAKKALKKKLSEKVDNITNRIEGLIDCKKHGENCELFIAEGKSALGSIIAARNPQNQAGIAIRGKLLNCLKTDYDTMFKNNEVVDIIKSLGCGIETDKRNKDLGCFDKKSLRYERVIIATDADPDGYQIACLLLTMFYRLTPTLIRDGHIYIALTPLFEVKDLKNKKFYYAFSEEEKNEIISKLDKYEVNRNKGLGEVDADVMARTGVNPETRNILKVTYEDATQMVQAFEDWMGNNVANRKSYIENDLNKYEAE